MGPVHLCREREEIRLLRKLRCPLSNMHFSPFSKLILRQKVCRSETRDYGGYMNIPRSKLDRAGYSHPESVGNPEWGVLIASSNIKNVQNY